MLRYGLYRSQLGVGLDAPAPHGNELTLNLFDPNHLKLDGYVAFPRVFGPAADLLVGVRDLNEENLFVAGVRFRRTRRVEVVHAPTSTATSSPSTSGNSRAKWENPLLG